MGLKWGYGDGQAGPCMALVHGWCMVFVYGVVHGVLTWGFEVSINDVVYYLDGRVVGLVMLGLSIGVGFWMRWWRH